MRNILLATVLAGGLAFGAGFIELPGISGPGKKDVSTNKGEVVQQTWLMVGTVESDTSGDADWLYVASHDRKKKTSFMMYVPRTTFVEIPGFGLETLDKALSLGHEPLLITAAANLLGAGFDHFIKISDQGMQALFDKFGGVTVDVGERLTEVGVDGKSRVIFSEGPQPMNGKRSAEFISFKAKDGEEISRGARHARLWEAVLTHFRSDSEITFGDLMKNSADLYTTDATPADVERFFDQLASATEPVQEILPVKATGVDAGVQLYSPEREDIEKMVARYLSGSKPPGGGRLGRKVQILNGNGEPGIGEDVGKRLVSKGFRVVLDSNAKRFDYDVTQIVVYSDSKRSLAVAEEIRAALGVGEILVSRNKQSVVDVTIVVGKDYLRARK
ncbi:MAG: LCP family protein [Actinomycetota bacterium]